MEAKARRDMWHPGSDMKGGSDTPSGGQWLSGADLSLRWKSEWILEGLGWGCAGGWEGTGELQEGCAV